MQRVDDGVSMHICNAGRPCVVHGIACWFDVLFDGSTSQRWLSTAPGQPTTHWYAFCPSLLQLDPAFVSPGCQHGMSGGWGGQGRRLQRWGYVTVDIV